MIRLCTTNLGKIEEFKKILEPLGLEVSFGEGEAPETQDTFFGNALEKAQVYHKLYPGDYILADDSGLCVNALGGRPGVYSARYTDREELLSPEIRNANNIAKVLEELDGVLRGARDASYTCCLVLLSPTGDLIHRVESKVYGEIHTEPKGDGGFGYDSIFISHQSGGKTWAELTLEERSKISHRSRATILMSNWIKDNL